MAIEQITCCEIKFCQYYSVIRTCSQCGITCKVYIIVIILIPSPSYVTSR